MIKKALVATALVLAVSSISPLATDRLDAEGVRRNSDSWPGRVAATTALQHPSLHNSRPHELAYVDAETLVVVRFPDAPVYHRAWVVSAEGDIVGDWPKPPSGSWWPLTVASDDRRQRVVFGSGDDPLLVFAGNGSWIGGWKTRPTDPELVLSRIRMRPGGGVFAVTDSEPRVRRWDSDGFYEGPWRSKYSFYDFAVDDMDRVLLLEDDGGQTLLNRFDYTGARIDRLRPSWPPVLGPTPAFFEIHNLAVDLTYGNLLVFNTSQESPSCHVLRYASEDGAFLSALPLWRLGSCRHQIGIGFLAARPGQGLALTWYPDSRLGVFENTPGISQFSLDGTLDAVTRMSLAAAPFEEVWQRARLSEGDMSFVLYPHSGFIGALKQDGVTAWQRQAPPFAMDISANTQGKIAVRGWDGHSGRATLLGSDGSTAWSVACNCPLATGICRCPTITTGIVPRFH